MSNRLILGSFANTFVLRVSRPGYNVLDDSLPPECISFDSRWQETMNVIQSGRVNFNGQPSLTINHYLGNSRPLILWSYVMAEHILGNGRTSGHSGNAYYDTNTFYVLRDADNRAIGVRYVIARSTYD